MRRYDLDWIRIGVFGLLIFYHIGMFFVPWPWHIKNATTYTWVTYPMLFVNQWRLPILFVISGMGTRFALSQRSWRQFLAERGSRLLVPLVFGMLVVVAPQVYVERLVNGQFEGSFFDFYPFYFEGVYPEGNFSWHHLWFLPYLLVFSLMLSPLFVYIRNHPNAKGIQLTRYLLASKVGIFVFLLPLVLATIYLQPLFPVTHDLVSDGYAFTYYLIYFFYGFLFISAGEVFWLRLKALKQTALGLGILAFASYLVLDELGAAVPFAHEVMAVVKGLNIGCWMVVVFGYAHEYLAKAGRWRTYFNQAVYPFYIVHQTITVVLAAWLYDAGLHDFVKFLLLLAGTFGGSWLVFEMVRRTRLTRLLFGIKAPPPGNHSRPVWAVQHSKTPGR